MKSISAILFFLLPFIALSHDGHHHHTPRSSSAGPLGAFYHPVTKGTATLYKAEMITRDRRKVDIYIYNLNGGTADLSKFSDVANAKIENGQRFALKKGTTSFQGKLPKIKRRPFEVSVSLSEGQIKLKMDFKNVR